MDFEKILAFVDSTIKNDYDFDPERLNDFSREEMLELLSLLIIRVESREGNLKELVDTLEQKVQERTLELAEKNRKLEELAIRDELTKLYNRRFFNEKLEEYSHLARRFGQPLCCVMTDIDHFKKFNDNHGHQAGDYVLYSFAQILENNTRSTDISARYGGEEFVIILPNTDLETGVMLAEKLRKMVESEEVSYNGAVLKITSSFGVATKGNESEPSGALVKRADDALYKAKEAGRNRVCS